MTIDHWQTPSPLAAIPSMTPSDEPPPPAIDATDPEWQRAQLRRLRLESSEIPARFRRPEVSVHAWLPEDEAGAALKRQLADYVKTAWSRRGTDEPAGLLLWGGRGRGKTHLACAVAKALITLHCARVLYAQTTGIFSEIKATFGRDDGDTEDGILERLSEIPVLLLDDLGSGRCQAEWEAEKLYQVIDARYGNGKITIITTNWSPLDVAQPQPREAFSSDLARMVGERVTSRLLEMCEIHQVCGTDHRAPAMKGKT